jgi:ABC-2 type transport system permease protein
MSETTRRQAGTIYDIGYQHYHGVRLGRANAVRTLAGYSFSSAFGRGRGEKARIIPLIMILLAYGPALVQITMATALSRPEMIHYDQQLEIVGSFLALFAAGQAPELVVTDRQYRVLPLYLSRSLRATDYALAKLGAFFAALVILTTGPELALWTGKVLLAASPKQGVVDNWHSLAPILCGTLVAALYIASVALALASFTARRAFGTAAVIAFFLLTPVVSGIAGKIATGNAERWVVLSSPFTLIEGFANWLFDIEAHRRSMTGRADLPGQVYLYVMLGTAIVAAIALVLRYRGRDA